jgi:hypothetical protein
MPFFPNIPVAPGVPILNRNPIVAASQIILLAEDLISIFVGGLFGPQWGIFLDGEPVVMADSVISFDFKQDWTVPTYSVEQGGFESYDKVQLPFEVRLRMTAGGDQTSRQNFLDSIQAIVGDFNLYDAVTPEEVYTSVNVTHWDYHRSAQQGAGLITVDIQLTEIRVTATTQFGNTQSPVSSGQQAQGQTQTGTVAPQVTQSITSAMSTGSASMVPSSNPLVPDVTVPAFSNGGTGW